MAVAALVSLVVLVGYLALWLVPIVLGLFGLLRPTRDRVVDGLYWTAYGFFAAHLVLSEFILVGVIFWWSEGHPLPAWYPYLLVPGPVFLLLVTANSLWVKAQETRVRTTTGQGGGERGEWQDRLKRRLWLPLLAVLLLEVADSVILPRVFPKPPAAPVVSTTTSTSDTQWVLPASSAEENQGDPR